MTGLTPKQEAAAQAYVECGDKSEAYRRCYVTSGMKPATINRAAFELFENPKMTARVQELQEMHRRRHMVTVDSLTAELDDLKERATIDKQYSPAVTAVMGKAKLHGLLIDKNEHTGRDGGPIITKEQRDAAVAAALGADS